MELSFHGADRDVTGSCHLLECAGKRLLVDCGMFQGGRELQEENAAELGFDAATIDFLLLTHAHLDHCGRLPLLVKRGFHGEIIATAATAELAQIVMLDAAHMSEEDAEWRSRHARDGKPVEALYTQADVAAAMSLFGRVAARSRSARQLPRRGPHPRLRARAGAGQRERPRAPRALFG